MAVPTETSNFISCSSVKKFSKRREKFNFKITVIDVLSFAPNVARIFVKAPFLRGHRFMGGHSSIKFKNFNLYANSSFYEPRRKNLFRSAVKVFNLIFKKIK